MTFPRILRVFGMTILAIWCGWCASAFARHVVHDETLEWQKVEAR